MSKPRAPRRKSDGSYEVSIVCQVCGSRKCEVNTVTREFHCWCCSAGGRAREVPGYGLSFLSSKDGPMAPLDTPTTPGEDLDLTADLPLFALQECKRRRQEPQWLIRQYNVRWSRARGRLWFPAGDGGVLRSVLSWEQPKTLAVPPKGLIGAHLLTPGARIVLCEGDWKTVSIPIPWVGIGLQGTSMSPEQKFAIRNSMPSRVFVMLDGGCHVAAQKIVEDLLPMRATRIDLPGSAGPDDIPRSQLVSLLLAAERR